MADSFALHLGGGFFVGRDGVVVLEVPEQTQIYALPPGVRCEPSRVRLAANEFAGLLTDPGEGQSGPTAFGVPPKQVDAFKILSTFVKALAKTNEAFGKVAEVGLEITAALVGADDGISPMLATAVTDLKNQLLAAEARALADEMLQLHAQFAGTSDVMRKRLLQAALEKPVGAAKASLYADLQDIVDDLATPLNRLLGEDWMTSSIPEFYKGRAFLAPLLVLVRADGTLVPLVNQPPTASVFEYRLGVPMLLDGVATFSAMVSAAMPWFRSAGLHAHQFRTGAAAIEAHVLKMQLESLARTEHTASSILGQQVFRTPEVPAADSSPFAFGFGPISYPVGAFDLVRYDDTFLSNRWLEAFQTKGDLGQRGAFDYTWSTPLALLDEIAAAANEQARQDYAQLQVLSGSFHLLITAAFLRFLSTPPRQSETVRGRADATRNLVGTSTTTARSPDNLPGATVERRAILKRYVARARARIETHPPGYVPGFRYRVLLRTLESQFGDGGWDPRGYVGRAWQVDYEPAQGNPRDLRLRTSLQNGLILGTKELYSGPSPTTPESRSQNGLQLAATTFDWFVPILPAPRLFDIDVDLLTAPGGKSAKKEQGAARDAGGLSPHLLHHAIASPGPMSGLMGGNMSLHASMADTWEPGAIGFADVALDLGERRHVREETIEIDWKLTWADGRLDVEITGRPDQRPFQVMVVVEETVYSGETLPENPGDILSNPTLVDQLHTVFVAEIVNQQVLVPEDFFEEEGKALKRGEMLWREFEREYAISAPIGPGDPIVAVLDRVRDMVNVSPSTATLAGSLDARMQFARETRPDLLDVAMRRADAAASRATSA